VRILFWFLLLAAAAVGVALATRLTAGYVLVVAPPYRVEVSLNLFILLVVLGFAGGYVVVRGIVRALRVPDEVRAYRRRRQQERARAKHDAAVVALLEGRYGRARQSAEEALAIPQSTGLSALVAARAAIEMHDFDAAEQLLARPDAEVASLAVPRLMLQAQLKLETGQPGEALARLQALRKEAGAHTAALQLERKALQAAGRYADIPSVVDQLVKRKALRADEADLLRAVAHAQVLDQCGSDSARLRSYWSRLSDADQRLPRVAAAGARGFLAVGADHEAAEILARSLERQWEPDLALLYARCRPADATRQLELAESWLKAHSQDAKLLHALGVLCERQQLWGKAQTYLEASLALDNNWRGQVALGELLARLGRNDEATPHLAAALKLALAELGQS
jgi:HemY protein